MVVTINPMLAAAFLNSARAGPPATATAENAADPIASTDSLGALPAEGDERQDLAVDPEGRDA